MIKTRQTNKQKCSSSSNFRKYHVLTYGLILDISILEPLGEFLTKETH